MKILFHAIPAVSSPRNRASRKFAVLMLSLALALTACGPRKTLIFPPESTGTGKPQTSIPVAPAAPSLQEAQDAWRKGDMPAAERLYGLLANTPGLSLGEQQDVWKAYAMAAAANKHPNVALEALQRWRSIQPEADKTSEWQDTWYKAAGQLSPAETIRRANAIYVDASRPWPLRAQAGLLLATRQWETGSPDAALKTLSDIYAQASPTWRAALEKRLYDELSHTTPATLDRLQGSVTAENEGAYPYNVIQLEYARRLVATPGGTGRATDVLSRLQRSAHFEDPQLLGSVLSGDKGAGASSGCVALALPMSGPFGPIGWKVARGASSAQWELARTGQNVDVRVVNTEAPDWIEQVSALPQMCTVVGGPLRTTIFSQAKARQLPQQRAFFTFVPQLDEGEEGKLAWRFFTSSEDQVAALLRFTVNDLGISRYGTLYPDEAYGRRMANLFSQMAEQQGSSVKSTSYPPANPEAWNGIAAGFVGARKVNDYPVPTANFQATFLPDGWKQAEMLVPNIFYHGEDRQVLLGTALWEQGLSGQKKVDVHNFGLAVFPGSWNPATPTSAGIALTDALRQAGLDAPDVWVGLGYDFVRFSSQLGVKPGWTPQQINSQLSTPQSMSWSIAPIRWSPQGIASQELFLFTPTENGFEPVDPVAFKDRLERVRARHEQRIKAASAPKQ